MNGYYEIKSAKGGRFVFNLKAANHEVILTSQTYEAKSGAQAGIASVQANGSKKEAFEKKMSEAKQPFFILKAPNGQIIGKSEMYSSESGRDNGIASVIANSATRTIKEVEEKPKPEGRAA